MAAPLVDPNDPRFQEILKLIGGAQTSATGIQYPDPSNVGQAKARETWATTAGLPSGFDPAGLWGGKDNENSGQLPGWMNDLIAKYNSLTDPAEKAKLWRHIVLGEGVADKYKAAAALNPMTDAMRAAILAALGPEPGSPDGADTRRGSAQ